MPAVLPSGHYWISVQPDMDFATEGIWNWTMRTEAAGDEFAWRNPGGGWNNPCTDWGSRSSCGYNLPNLAFRLAGTKADCVPHNVGWLRVSPMSGTLEGDSVSAVDVTINTNDLADGSYRADLCILNNDPNSGIYTLPVELTVGKVFGYLPMVVR